MKLFTTQLATLSMLLCMTGAALATGYRIDFTGTIDVTNEHYNGYAIMDYSTPDSNGEPTHRCRFLTA